MAKQPIFPLIEAISPSSQSLVEAILPSSQFGLGPCCLAAIIWLRQYGPAAQCSGQTHLQKNPESTETIKMVYSGKHAIMGPILFSNMMTVASP